MNYYNDTDPYVCDWLAALIQAQLIPPGYIDRRPIQDVRPYELAPFTQCHFFAGIAGWPSALALAGVGPDRPLWTGSCPCQPFSQAGKGRGLDDERHLWPFWHHLISICRPPIVFGEQVASPDGLDWVDLVQDDVEDQDYAFGKSDICAAGVGAPHIRQRLYFVALADGEDAGSERQQRSRQHGQQSQNGFVGGLAFSEVKQLNGIWNTGQRRQEFADGGIVGNAQCEGLARRSRQRSHDGAQFETAERAGGAIGGMEYATREQVGLPGFARELRGSFWTLCDWLPCTDGKSRPVEPGTFPLAHGVPARVAKLRALGNAIVRQVAATFIKAALGT